MIDNVVPFERVPDHGPDYLSYAVAIMATYRKLHGDLTGEVVYWAAQAARIMSTRSHV